MRKALLVGSLLLIVMGAAAPARAQGYFAPFIGYDFGGDAGSCPSFLNNCTEKKTSYGVAFGGLSGGVLGFEEDIGYAPDFFGKSPTFGSNSVLSLMSNLVVGIPIGGIRPYVSGGVGLMRTHATFSLNSGSQSQNTFAYDLGGGVMFFLPGHFGFRGDYRYFKSLQDFSLLGFTIANPRLSFHRASVALVIH
jgi:opacity protein-like surface antigen